MGVAAAANITRQPVTIDNKVIEEGTLFASAARTTAQTGVTMVNPGFKGVIVTVDITAVGVTPSDTFTIKGYDIASNKWNTILASTAKVATGTTVMTVLPSVVASANVAVSQGIPAQWRVDVAVGNATTATYSVGYSYIG
jgi:hypothetical protein